MGWKGGIGRIGISASVFVVLGLSVSLWPASTHAQQAAPKQTTGTGEVNLKATSANVKEPGSPVRLTIVRWSTDEERRPVVAALNPVAPVSAPPAGDSSGAAPGGRGGAGRGGRGGAGRGGRGDAAPLNPIDALTAAIGKGPTLGYIWTTDVTGYSIKYAYHASLPDGGERIVLATDRRLGAYTTGWKPVTAAPVTDYDFTVIEIRLDAKGLGEGKTSLTTKVIVDDNVPGSKTVALDNYAATPAILQNVKH
jgi:hypothetical protein